MGHTGFEPFGGGNPESNHSLFITELCKVIPQHTHPPRTKTGAVDRKALDLADPEHPEIITQTAPGQDRQDVIIIDDGKGANDGLAGGARLIAIADLDLRAVSPARRRLRASRNSFDQV